VEIHNEISSKLDEYFRTLNMRGDGLKPLPHYMLILVICAKWEQEVLKIKETAIMLSTTSFTGNIPHAESDES
jgi:hypothetical protein